MSLLVIEYIDETILASNPFFSIIIKMNEVAADFRNLMAEIEEKNVFPEAIKRLGKRYEVNIS